MGRLPLFAPGGAHWDDEHSLSFEQFHLLNLETGELHEYTLTDQGYPTPTMTAMLRQAGFGRVDVFPNWDGVELYDAKEWVMYLAER